jgi:predicted AlkP superfamily phosphohydrolase/phosphomutase
MALFKKKKKDRACVIGLDGVPYSLVLELAERGVMPSLAGLLKSGQLHKMKASLPEISAVSWTDFMTGTDSGTHGVFGFTDFRPESYALRFPNFLDVRGETLWDLLGKTGKRAVVLNQPSTYPARRLNGVLISGFVALDLARAVYPPSRTAVLERMGYRVDIDTLKSRQDHEFFWEELRRTTDGRERVLDYLWEEDWDYFEIVFTGTDRLHHYLWNSYGDRSHRYHARFLDYYRRLDGIIGRVVHSYRRLTGDEAGLYLLSDHGFCQIEQEVYLNAWLEKEGFLRFAGDSPQGIEDVAEGTLAFGLDPNRVYLHLKGRFPGGTVEEADRGSLKAEISDRLGRLEYKGRRVIRKVFDAGEVYSGPLASAGPDLLVLSEPGFDLKGSVKKKEVFGRTDLEGMHTWDDAFFWSEQGSGEDLKISQLRALILGHYR